MNRSAASSIALFARCLLLALLVSCRAEVVDSPVTPTLPATPTVGSLPPRPITPTPTAPPGAAQTPTEPPPVEHGLGEHTVQPGDTLLGIATEYGVPMAAIQLQNGMGDSVVVQVGQVLTIPSLDGWEEASRFWVVHVVKAGDTLVGIAGAYGLKAAEIKAANGIADADLIVIGQELVIPLDAPATTPVPTPAPTHTPARTDTPVPTFTPTATLTSTALYPRTTALSPAPTAASAAPPPADVAAWAYEIARLINKVRAQHSLPPLAYNETLAGVAQAHANDCLQRGWGSHTGSDGSNVKTRMQRAGYDPVRWSECWAHTLSPQSALDLWMDEVPPDDPHRRTILSTWLTEIGVGVGKPDWGYYFFADFGTPRG